MFHVEQSYAQSGILPDLSCTKLEGNCHAISPTQPLTPRD